MPQVSAGLLMYRVREGRLEVLLAHPGGPFFAKKDDAEGTDFYFLGEARSSNAVQTKMPDSKGVPLNVVTMELGMESSLERSLYEYLTGTRV